MTPGPLSTAPGTLTDLGLAVRAARARGMTVAALMAWPTTEIDLALELERLEFTGALVPQPEEAPTAAPGGYRDPLGHKKALAAVQAERRGA